MQLGDLVLLVHLMLTGMAEKQELRADMMEMKLQPKLLGQSLPSLVVVATFTTDVLLVHTGLLLGV